MKLTQYVPFAIRTEKPLPTQERFVHGCMGLTTEIGEVVTELKRMHIYGKPLDQTRKTHLLEEAGDVMWYVAIMLDATGIDLELVENAPGIDATDLACMQLYDILSLTLSFHGGAISSLILGRQFEKTQDQTSSEDGTSVLLANLVMIIFAITALCNLCGSTLEEVMVANIEKLRIRFPNAYSNEAAEGRADKGGADARVS